MKLQTRNLIPVALLALFALQSLWFIGTQSLTYDEPAHIIPGVEAWQQGKFEHWNDQPPLARLWGTLLIARSDVKFAWQQLPVGFRVTGMQPGPEWIAWRTRPMITLLGLALGAALWFAARQIFSQGAANVSLALFAFTPSLIAHYSVVTTDGMGALFIFLTAWQVVRWRLSSTWAQTVLLGLSLGGLLLAKFYAPPLVALALGLVLVLGQERGLLPPPRWNWKPVLVAASIMLLTVWAGYFFHMSRLKIANGQVTATFANRPVKSWATKSNAKLDVILPAGELVEGFREVAMNNRHGRPAWFLGKIYAKGGIRLYYPVAIALKWPTIVLLLFFISIFGGLRKSARAPGDLLILSLFALVYLAFALQSRYDIGERHILPLYPFVLMIAGGVWEAAKRLREDRGLVVGPRMLGWPTLAKAGIVLVLLLNAADGLRYAPDYLSYFNVFVRPENSWRLLTDSNLDWGQGLIVLRNYEQRHPGEQVHLAYFGSVDPALYGVRAEPLPPGQSIPGTAVVGATCLSGQVLENPDGYHWLWPLRPRQVLNHSLWLYEVPQ